MRTWTIFQKAKDIEFAEVEHGPTAAKSAHKTQKAYLQLPSGRISRRLAFIKSAANGYENDVELAFSQLSQLDGPYAAKSVGLAVFPQKSQEARSAVASLCLKDFCSYRDLTKKSANELADHPLHRVSDKAVGFSKVKGLASILLSAYRDGEDDFHRQNFGVFRNDDGELVWGRIDFGLECAEITKISPRTFRDNGFSQDAYSLITLKDLENFPTISDSSLFYWPTKITTTNSRLNPNSGNRYKDVDKILFETLKDNEAFKVEKHEFILRQMMQPLSLKRACILENVADREPALELADAIEFRHFTFLMTAIASPEIRAFLKDAIAKHRQTPDGSLISRLKEEQLASFRGLTLENEESSDGFAPQIDKTFADLCALVEQVDNDNRIGSNPQEDLNNIAKVKANEIILRPYHQMLTTLEKNTDVPLSSIYTELKKQEKAVVNAPFNQRGEPSQAHEVFLIKSEKAKTIRRFSATLSHVMNIREEFSKEESLLAHEKRALIDAALESFTRVLSDANSNGNYGLDALVLAQRELVFLPYQLKLLDVREKFERIKAVKDRIPVTRLKQILLAENGQRGPLSEFFYQKLVQEGTEHNERSKIYPFLNHKAAESYLHLLETCREFFEDEPPIKEDDLTSRAKFRVQLFKVNFRMKQALTHQQEEESNGEKARIDNIVKQNQNRSIYEIDCLVARLALESEITKAQQKLKAGDLPPGFSDESFKAIISAAKGVVKAVAKPTYHENKSLADVALAATHVAHCLQEPTLENALLCHNHVETLTLSRKTRAKTIFMGALSAFCFTVAVATMAVVGLAAISSGLGFIPGILALSLSIKLSIMGSSTLGIGFGGYATYRFFRDEDIMKRKLTTFAETALESIEGSRVLPA